MKERKEGRKNWCKKGVGDLRLWRPWHSVISLARKINTHLSSFPRVQQALPVK